MSPRWRPSPLLQGTAALHAGAAAAVAAAPAVWPFALAAAVASHAALVAAGLLPRCGLLGPNLTRLPPPARAGRVALTFDDGPDPEVTPAVLDLLEAHGQRASFFCVGRSVAAHPGLAREIHRRGHRLENHSHLHSNGFFFLGPRQLVREVTRAQEEIADAVGRRPVLFRAPAGVRSPLLDPVLSRAGLRLASWTRRGYDTTRRDPVRIASRLLAGLRAGDILLLHDGSGGRAGHGARLLPALGRVLETLAGAGLSSIPLDESLGIVAG